MLQAVSSQFCSTLRVTWKLRRVTAQLHQLAWLLDGCRCEHSTGSSVPLVGLFKHDHLIGLMARFLRGRSGPWQLISVLGNFGCSTSTTTMALSFLFPKVCS
jgi:hypothetical protein